MKKDEDNNVKEVVKPFTNGRISYDESDTQTPFVNEECGDTMWDAVLEQEEKRAGLKSILLGKTGSGSK